MVSLTANAADSCSVDCHDALKKCDILVQDLKDQVSVQTQIMSKQQERIVDLQSKVDTAEERNRSILRNPYVMVLTGILAGTALTLYLQK